MSISPLPQPESRQTVPDLIRQLFAEMTDLIQQHIQLTKTEVKEEGQRLSKAVVYGVIALVFFQVTLVFLGGLIMMLMMLAQATLFSASFYTTLFFLVIAGVFVALCVRQVRSARNILKS